MTVAKRTPIPLRRKLKPCFLAEDYGAGQYHWSSIHSENLVDARRKAQFLHDARHYLRSVRAHLHSAGFLGQCIAVNRFFRPPSLFMAFRTEFSEMQILPACKWVTKRR